jgi:hypothetical protein
MIILFYLIFNPFTCNSNTEFEKALLVQESFLIPDYCDIRIFNTIIIAPNLSQLIPF